MLQRSGEDGGVGAPRTSSSTRLGFHPPSQALEPSLSSSLGHTEVPSTPDQLISSAPRRVLATAPT